MSAKLGSKIVVPSDVIDVERLETLKEIGQGDASGLLEELTVLFRDTRDEYLRAVQNAIAAQDPNAVEKAIHTFKASSRSLGASFVVARCEQIERAAHAGDLDHAAAVFESLQPIIAEAVEALFAIAQSRKLDE